MTMTRTQGEGGVTFESVFTFGEPIVLREIPLAMSRLQIYRQTEAEIVVQPSPSPHSSIQNKPIPSKEKQSGTIDNRSKIGKALLRECHTSTVECLSELLQSIRTLSMQLIKLSTQTSHEPILKALHTRTIDPSLKALDQSINKIDLPIAYRQLFEATETIKGHMASFRKAFKMNIQSGPKGLPHFFKIFNSLSQ